MPQNNAPKQQQKKKKKGPAPAHQNAFAFQHNPKSKKTAKILELPNTHVCRRCHEKIEWRKKYRKYKPRTQPGKCNLCQQKRVMAAYHTICEPCTKTEQAIHKVKIELKEQQQRQLEQQSAATDGEPTVDQEQDNMDTISETVTCSEHAEAAGIQEVGCENTPHVHEEEMQSTLSIVGTRACAMCVKDFALPDSDDEQDDYEGMELGGKRLTLRQRKTLERQRAARRRKNKKGSKGGDDNEDDSGSDDDDDEEEGNSKNDSDSELASQTDDLDLHDDDEDDPFLKAVGGVDKLLTGEAYQQALLQKEQQLRNNGLSS